MQSARRIIGSHFAVPETNAAKKKKNTKKKGDLKLSGLLGHPVVRAAPASPITAWRGLLMLICLQKKTLLPCHPQEIQVTG